MTTQAPGDRAAARTPQPLRHASQGESGGGAASDASPGGVRSRVEAPLLEVFSSVQGEGAFVGEPQVFLRLRGCPMRCLWCDTPGSHSLSEKQQARVALAGPSGGSSRHEPAWATPFQVACWIAEVEQGAPRTVSITGGEPLIWPSFVRGLRAFLGERRLHLETAGGHPGALREVLEAVDHISLDLKLPADMDSPVELPSAELREPAPATGDGWASAREACLTLVRDRDACAKIVVDGRHPPAEFDELLDDVERLAPSLPVYLQPATPVGDRAQRPSSELLRRVWENALERRLQVRVVPQVQRLLGLS